MSTRALICFTVVSVAAGCATVPKPAPVLASPETQQPEAPALPDAVASSPGLRFLVEPKEAEVIIDGESRGTVEGLGPNGGFIQLQPGLYQVSLKRPGFVTWRAEVAVREGPEPIQVTLVRK